MPEATAEAVADFIYEEIYCNFGAPTELLSDNGTNFTSEIVAHLMTRLATRHRYTTPYHPRTNGKVERLNGMLGTCLTKALMYRPTIEWDEVVQEALFACRIRAHAVSKVSPFVLVYGVEPRIQGNDEEFAMQHIQDDFEANQPNDRPC
jgi:transposase InsO family protein